MHKQNGLGFDSQVLFFMKPILLRECLSLGAQEATNVNTVFMWSGLVSRKSRQGGVEKRMFGLCLSSSREGKTTVCSDQVSAAEVLL